MKLLTERCGRVLVVTLSNPAARNAIGSELYPVASAVFREAAGDDGIGAIVLTGEGEHFCGGGNLNRVFQQRSMPPDSQRGNLDGFHAWILSMRACAKPVIAAVEGAAAGGGFALALACDLIVAADDAKFVMSYVRVALSPDGGGSDSLAKMLPPQAALEMLLDGDVVSAARLHHLGVVNRVTPHGVALREALGWAERLAQGPVDAHARIKRLVYGAHGRSRQEQLDAEREEFIGALFGDEAGEGIQAFLEKRAARYAL
ncbi:oxepin-CoA hydrolase, alternative type [Azoarcus sp. DN11]|uniref:oxepin-CoA hydrolase, alternative type n=1 Tax=Azoarcus sp. DN11 TaxID=356837 RepID=UPI000EAF02E6|nr:enoyl-CoA hydratase family protein [Azoarcus sp. DN11]AYH43563.1 enoyl-CoA hydratase [Azoarcus sp. DN11]